MIKAKAIGLTAVFLAGALLILFAAMHSQKMTLKRELERALNRVTAAEAALAVANANVALSNAVIDRQNTLIAGLENRLHTSRILAESQMEEIKRISDKKRAAVKDLPAEETVAAIRAHLIKFCGLPAETYAN